MSSKEFKIYSKGKGQLLKGFKQGKDLTRCLFRMIILTEM